MHFKIISNHTNSLNHSKFPFQASLSIFNFHLKNFKTFPDYKFGFSDCYFLFFLNFSLFLFIYTIEWKQHCLYPLRETGEWTSEKKHFRNIFEVVNIKQQNHVQGEKFNRETATLMENLYRLTPSSLPSPPTSSQITIKTPSIERKNFNMKKVCCKLH